MGLTGSFGSGKSTVARFFKPLGAKIIDADRIARKVVRPKTKIYKKIIAAFGRQILKTNNQIHRDRLAHLVFNNKNYLQKLNKIMHPAIIRIIDDEIKTSKARLIVLDAPLLIEAGLRNMVDKLIVVKLSRRQQIQRLLKKTRLTKKDILKRIKQQIPLEEKIRIADFIIDNNGSMQNTQKQVKEIRRSLWKN